MGILFVNEAKVNIFMKYFLTTYVKLHDKTCLQTARYACSFIL